MTSTANNFNKNSLKSKFTNQYMFDGYKTNGMRDTLKSSSPTRFSAMRESMKSSKNNSFLPMMNSYNNHPYKLMDNVNLKLIYSYSISLKINNFNFHIFIFNNKIRINCKKNLLITKTK